MEEKKKKASIKFSPEIFELIKKFQNDHQIFRIMKNKKFQPLSELVLFGMHLLMLILQNLWFSLGTEF